MDFNLSRSQKQIQKAAWEFARGKFDREMVVDRSRSQSFPRQILEKAGELGFIGIHFDESYEGGGMGLLEHVLVCESLCRKDSTQGSALMSAGYASEVLLRFGGSELCERYLPSVVSGQAVSTGAFLEKSGPDPGATAATGKKTGSGWYINGVKQFVPFADQAAFYIVLCRTDSHAPAAKGGLSLVLAEAGREGIQVSRPSDKLGGRMITFAEVLFSNLHIPLSNTIGDEGRGYSHLQRFLLENRIQIAAMALGTAQGAFDRALAHARQRRQFGKTLAEFPVTRHKLAEMAAQIESARCLTYSAAAGFDRGKATHRDSSIAKLMAARCAVAVADEAIQLLGGYGYMTEYEVEHFYRDAKHAEIFQGPPSVQKSIIADELIGKPPPRR
ncbi:MAG: acyl-CoA dehydrogenase family protein [Desulfosalsimonadaceae bacterium]